MISSLLVLSDDFLTPRASSSLPLSPWRGRMRSATPPGALPTSTSPPKASQAPFQAPLGHVRFHFFQVDQGGLGCNYSRSDLLWKIFSTFPFKPHGYLILANEPLVTSQSPAFLHTSTSPTMTLARSQRRYITGAHLTSHSTAISLWLIVFIFLLEARLIGFMYLWQGRSCVLASGWQTPKAGNRNKERWRLGKIIDTIQYRLFTFFV